MRALSLALSLLAASSCVGVTYQRAGQPVVPRAGQTLVETRVRFFHDGRELFPWSASLTTRAERHLWLLRLHPRAVSAELHPDADGSLSIWVASGDYALVGSTELPSGGTAPYEVLALLRVPAGAVTANPGELTFATHTPPDGWSVAHGEFGDASVTAPPQGADVSRWCVGEQVPGFNDPALAKRAGELLDGACEDPARITIYDARDSVVGDLVLGRSTVADAARLLAGLGGLGPRRDNEVTFHVGSATFHPPVLYTPPATMHQLYFANDTLVMVVAGVPHGLPTTPAEFRKRFPAARETRRESMWYELQTPLSDCVWLIAVFTTSTDRLESNGYARVCSN